MLILSDEILNTKANIIHLFKLGVLTQIK